MRRLTFLGVLAIFLLGQFSEASRLPEIESFYTEKVTEILKMRFPDKPFTVFVNIDTGKGEQSRTDERKASRNSKKALLPFFDVEQEELEVWDRTDLPLGTLIGQLERVRISIQVDSTLTEAELKELQASIAKQLKLDSRVDVVDVTKMDWTQVERYRNFKWIGGGGLAALALIFVIFWSLARLSVRQLVKGLAKPIQEIGKSTKKFANDALNMATDIAITTGPDSVSAEEDVDEDPLSLGSNLLEIRKNALELIQRNHDLFEKPDANFMALLERRGQQDPISVGSILAEVPESSLRTLFRYGYGQWWFVALAQAGQLSPKSITILSEIDKLRLRRHLVDDVGSKSTEHLRETGLVFSRLSPAELAVQFEGVTLERMAPVLDLLPRTTALAVAKIVYPGQWAVFLDPDRKVQPLDVDLLQKLDEKVQNKFPLRKETEIHEFFQELDVSNYLDIASLRDERDFYQVLPESSRIKQDRTPFFEVFEVPEAVRKVLGPVLKVNEWAEVLHACESSDRDSLTGHFPDRLKFQVNQALSVLNGDDIDPVRLRRLRRRVVGVCMEQLVQEQNKVEQLLAEEQAAHVDEVEESVEDEAA